MYVEGLEKLFHAGSLKEDEKARKGYKGVVEVNQFTKDNKGPNAPKLKKAESKKTLAPLKTSQPTPDKGAKRKEQDGKDGPKKPEAEGQRPCVENFITAEGCQFGRRCRYYHPNKAGKCRVCGAESQQAKDCTRPKEPNKEREKSRERPKSKAKAGARVATVEAEAGSASQSSALAWARSESADCPDVSGETSCALVALHTPSSPPPTSDTCRKALSCLCVRFCRNGLRFCRFPGFCQNGQRFRCLHEPCQTCAWPTPDSLTTRTDTAAVLEVADQLPTVMASKRSTEERDPLLDTGASHLLMNLDHLTEEQASEAKRIHVNQATGAPKRALLAEWCDICC